MNLKQGEDVDNNEPLKLHEFRQKALEKLEVIKFVIFI